jgi:hypothetical protein
MATLYEILGAPADASDDQLRQAYRRAARRLHPDVNPEVDADAMLQLNRAWAVLGVPDRRRSYDRSLQGPGPGPVEGEVTDGSAGGPAAGPDASEDPRLPPLARVLRPSAVIIAVLLVIFLVTAYAGPRPGGRTPSDPPPSSLPVTPPAGAGTAPAGAVPVGTLPGGTDPARLVGRCLRVAPGYDAVVSCSSANDGLVVTVASGAGACPPATRAYRLTGVGQIVCLDPNGS